MTATSLDRLSLASDSPTTATTPAALTPASLNICMCMHALGHGVGPLKWGVGPGAAGSEAAGPADDPHGGAVAGP
jgi:hypothetical protein